MAVLTGKTGSVKLGTYAIAELGTYTLSGFSRETLESSSFGDDIKEYQIGLGDGGEITFNGNYDPTDTTGQILLESALKNASVFTGGNLKFYINNTTYFSVSTGGEMLITKVKSINMDKAGIGKVDFTCKISGAQMAIINP